MLALAGGCGGGKTFVCSDDEQCVLAGTPGVCQPDGNCSYPDDACPSGYRYPTAAGGDCVPTDVATGAATDADAGTASATAPPTSTATETTSGPDTITGPDTTTMAPTGETGVDPSTGVMPCAAEPEEPVILEAEKCQTIAETLGQLDGAKDLDHYTLAVDASCAISQSVDVNADDPIRACIYFDCGDFNLLCDDGFEDSEFNGLLGCCDGAVGNPRPAGMVQDCSDPMLTMHIVIDSGPKGLCVPYVFTYGDG